MPGHCAKQKVFFCVWRETLGGVQQSTWGALKILCSTNTLLFAVYSDRAAAAAGSQWLARKGVVRIGC